MNTGEKQTQRKLTRLRGYDYSTPGYYFITICTKDKKYILSNIIVGDAVPYKFRCSRVCVNSKKIL